MFEWSPSYSVGIGSIDGQHQNLFAIGRELHAAMEAGQGKVAIGKILDRLVHYTSVHFAHEERLMQAHDYAEFEAHKAEHDALTAKVLKFQADFHAGKVNFNVQLLQFLRNWLQGHIQGSDQKYAPQIKVDPVA